jgi:NADPH-dependent F420 reductase
MHRVLTCTVDAYGMEIALLGGTGDIGEGLALRWAHDTDHDIVIGSREQAKAEQKADEYRTLLNERGVDGSVGGMDNVSAADRCSVVVVSIPPQYAAATVEEIVPVLDENTILVSPAVRMARTDGGFNYDPPEVGSVAEEIAAAAPDHIPVVGAFQNIAAGALRSLDADLRADVVITGNDADAKATIESLSEEIEGLRALDGGVLSNSSSVENVTPLLINLAINNDMHDLGVQFR